MIKVIPNIKLILFSILGILSPAILMAQNLEKEVIKTFSDGTPEIIYYYKGQKIAANRVKMEEYNSYGDKILEENYSEGKLHGKRSEFNNYEKQNRVISKENNYHNGIQHGDQINWFSNGTVKTKFYYNLGSPEGKQVEWFHENELRFELNYENGKPEGRQKEWYSSGTQKYDLNFVNGKLEGVQRWWSYSQDFVEEIWNNGIFTVSTNEDTEKITKEFIFYLDSTSISLDPSYEAFEEYRILSKRTHYKSGIRTEEYVFTEGEYSRESYKEWYPNGVLKQEGSNDGIRKSGIWITYHENGQNESKGNYDGVKDGHWLFWNEKGQLTDEKEFDQYGVQDWKMYTWHSNGTKESEGNISHIHKDGEWTYWTESGEIWRQEVYKLGPYSGNRPFIKEFTEWNKDGSKRVQGTDKYASHYYYNANQNKVAEIKLIYKKTRNRHEYLDDGVLTVNPNYEVNHGGGTINQYSFSEGFPLEVIHYYNNGQMKSHTRYSEIGVLDGNQEGWYENGENRYIYLYNGKDIEIMDDLDMMSGNSQLKEFTEWNKDGSKRVQGTDYYGTHFYYSASGNKIAELKLFYMKARNQHEYREDGKIKINPDYEAKRGGGTRGGGTIGDYSFSEGFPLELFHYYNDGQVESITRFCEKCITENPEYIFTGTLEGKQEGWYENGESRYIYFFINGCMNLKQKEWYEDGSLRFVITYSTNKIGFSINPTSDCHTYISSGVYYTDSGKEIIYQHEWDSKAQKKAYKSGDMSLLKSKEKDNKIIQIEAVSYLPTFLNIKY